MELMIIAIVVIVAFAAVLLPLLRRPAHGTAPDEFQGDPTSGSGHEPDRQTRTPATAATPATTATPITAAELAAPAKPATPAQPITAATLATPAQPITPAEPADSTAPPPAATLHESAPEPPDTGTRPPEDPALDDIEREVQRYRVALRAGTICTKCGQANPEDSRFCFDCGTALPLTEAREFD
jgi:hypothetical protein